MPNYYEILNIQPQATLPEIQAAYDKEYNKWRRLVTNHDPNVVTQANMALQALEKIHSTFTDFAAREAYDTGIGVKGAISGLVDPAAILRASPPTVLNTAHQSTRQESVQTTIDAWVCGKCKTANPTGVRHCENCGNAIGIECPSCGQLNKTTTNHCFNCGVNIQDVIRKKKLVEEDQRRQKEMEDAARLARQRELGRQQAEREQAKRAVSQPIEKIVNVLGIVIITVLVIALIVTILK